MKPGVLAQAAVHALLAIRVDLPRAAGVVLGVGIASAALTLLSALAASGEQAIVAATSGGPGAAALLEVSPAEPALLARPLANSQPLSGVDAARVAASATLRSSAVATRQASGAVATWRGGSDLVTVFGISSQLAHIVGLRLASGRPLDAGDFRSRSRVALVGSRLAERLLDSWGRPVRRLTLNRAVFEVVGVLAPAPAFSSSDPLQWDNAVLVTTSAFETGFAAGDRRLIDRLFVAISAGLDGGIGRSRAVVRNILGQPRGRTDEFTLDDGEDEKGRLQLVLQIVGALLATTATISLLVSSLNVMNATLISTAERCYEIGLRRSLGATRQDVFWQFVIEAGVLSLLGALVGLIFGLLLALASGTLMRLATDGWQLRIYPWGPLLATVVPVLVSGLFSVYPAWRGASQPPVSALRAR